MRSVNFDDLDDEPALPLNGTARAPGTEPGTAVPAEPLPAVGAVHGKPVCPGTFMSHEEALATLSATEVPANTDFSGAQVTPIADVDLVADPHEMLTFGPLTGDGTGEALSPVPDSAYPPGAGPLADAAKLPVDIPAKPARSIYEAEHALQSPSRSLADSFDTVVKNVHRLTPGQVEVLHAVLMELGADLDVDGAAGYGPEFDMTAFIQRMIKTTKAIENRLYRPGEDGMQPAFSAQELGAITNANKNLLMMIAKNHDKVMGWERQRAIEAAHMAAARDLPADIQDRYLARLQQELEARGL